MKFFLDLDDVLSDFTGVLTNLGINNSTSFIHKPRSEWTEDQKELDRVVSEQMLKPGFWAELPVKQGAHLLWDYVQEHQPFILTARPRGEMFDSIVERIKLEKLEWVRVQFGNDQMNRTIICQRHEKPAWASDSGVPNILVDDMEQNCKEWEESGGKAFHYKGFVSDTIDEINKWKFSATR